MTIELTEAQLGYVIETLSRDLSDVTSTDAMMREELGKLFCGLTGGQHPSFTPEQPPPSNGDAGELNRRRAEWFERHPAFWPNT